MYKKYVFLNENAKIALSVDQQEEVHLRSLTSFDIQPE